MAEILEDYVDFPPFRFRGRGDEPEHIGVGGPPRDKGACCRDDGDGIFCEDLKESDCADVEGEFMGVGTRCDDDPDPCAVVGCTCCRDLQLLFQFCEVEVAKCGGIGAIADVYLHSEVGCEDGHPIPPVYSDEVAYEPGLRYAHREQTYSHCSGDPGTGTKTEQVEVRVGVVTGSGDPGGGTYPEPPSPEFCTDNTVTDVGDETGDAGTVTVSDEITTAEMIDFANDQFAASDFSVEDFAYATAVRANSGTAYLLAKIRWRLLVINQPYIKVWIRTYVVPGGCIEPECFVDLDVSSYEYTGSCAEDPATIVIHGPVDVEPPGEEWFGAGDSEQQAEIRVEIQKYSCWPDYEPPDDGTANGCPPPP